MQQSPRQLKGYAMPDWTSSWERYGSNDSHGRSTGGSFASSFFCICACLLCKFDLIRQCSRPVYNWKEKKNTGTKRRATEIRIETGSGDGITLVDGIFPKSLKSFVPSSIVSLGYETTHKTKKSTKGREVSKIAASLIQVMKFKKGEHERKQRNQSERKTMISSDLRANTSAGSSVS